MNALLVLLLACAAIVLGYGWYAKRIDRTVIQPDDSKATPAKLYMDGVDFTPADRNVLFGYQFKSIAALGPITGPIVAVQYGWLPALIWILLGTFFIGWVQDYASIMLGVREEGQTFGALSYRLISPRARTLLLVFIYFYLWLIMGAFGYQIGFGLLTKATVPLGVLAAIGLGLLAGQMTYRWKQDIILTTIVTVVLAFVGIYLGTLPAVQSFFNIILGYGAAGKGKPPILFLTIDQAKFVGSLAVVIICYFGGVLPIWRWAQPINYVCFWIVLLGVIGGVLGLIIWHPGMADFPAFTTFNVSGLGPLWPILFVTIACGAISGWHSLVSSSGTARQLEKESDALFVGGGAMFLEMFFATIAFLTATVGMEGYKKYLDVLKVSPASVFSAGLAKFMNQWGLPSALGTAYGSVFLVLMGLTIMYLVVRFMRVASAEALGDRFPALRNEHVGTVIALLFTLALIWLVPFLQIWVLFGAANQLMASLALLLISLWLLSKGKQYAWAFWPFVFMFLTTMAALVWNVYQAFFIKLPAAKGEAAVAQVIIGVVAIVLFIAALILAIDGLRALQKARAGKAAARA